MWGACRINHPSAFGSRSFVFTGAVVMSLGVALIGTSFAMFRRSDTTIDPVRPNDATSLVVSGPFRYTRNPMYVGLTIVLVGWCVALASAWGLAGALVFALFITRFQILPEEKVMRAKFGAEYDAYAQRVRRWF